MTPDDLPSVERVSALGGSLLHKAAQQQALRTEIEERWLEDLRQYNGRYTPSQEAALLSDPSKVRAFVNITRKRATSWEARITDMLFPTDDRNWAIQPTPVPELAALSNDQRPTSEMGADGQPLTMAQWAQAQMDQAKKRAEAMQREIDDQHTESDYQSHARDMIHDAGVLGTGVLKAPVVVARTRKAWTPAVGEDGQPVHVLEMKQEHAPTAERVDPWNLFPDMSAVRIGDAEFVFERSFRTKAQLIDMAKSGLYDEQAIRNAVAEEPKNLRAVNARLEERREISGITTVSDNSRYECWEYHGPINKDDLAACGCDVSDDDLDQVEGVVWFVGTHVIRAELNTMDTQERPYSVFCCEEDDTSVFGYGIPYLMRNPQKVVNQAWRLLLENADVSAIPQIVMRKGLVPLDGSYSLHGGKEWWLPDDRGNVRDAFATHQITSNQPQLIEIFNVARQLADEETALPLIAQGEQTGKSTDTFGGMSILMNAANIMTRRTIKQFDDNITRPVIKRYYDWNMQFNLNEAIKGDFAVDARGSSVLLLREIQSQNLMVLADQFAAHPIFGPMTKAPELYRKMVQSHQISADDVVKTDDEIATDQANQPQQPDPESMKLQLQYRIHQEKLADAQQERQFKLQLAGIDKEIAITKLMAETQLSREQVDSRLTETQVKIAGDRQKIADEARIKLATGSGI